MINIGNIIYMSDIRSKFAAYMNSIMLCGKIWTLCPHYEIVLNVKYFAKTQIMLQVWPFMNSVYDCIIIQIKYELIYFMMHHYFVNILLSM